MKSGFELQKSGLTRKRTKFGGSLACYFFEEVVEMRRFLKAKFITQLLVADIAKEQRTFGFGDEFTLNVIFS